MAEIFAIMRKDGETRIPQEHLNSLSGPLASEGRGEAFIRSSGPWSLLAYVREGEDARDHLWEDDTLAVICDAEIYNRKELERGSAPGEAALVADLYRRHGTAWWERVRGAFRAVILDKTSRTALAFTDHVGIKNLVYSESAKEVAVGSRIAPLARLPGFARKLDGQAAYSYLFMEMIPTPYTIFQGIKKLESGHFLKITDGRATVHRFWKMPFPAAKATDQAETCRRVYGLLQAAVAEQSEYGADLEQVGEFLSGGTDSSTICGLVDALHPGGARTFSIGFDEDGFDESEYARLAAKAFRTRHTEYRVTAKDVEDSIPLLVKAYDEPFANSSAIPTYFCSRLAAGHGIKVMLAGDGGDEIFGGNSRYAEVLEPPGRIPPWMARSLVAPMARALGAIAPHPLVKRVEGHARRAYEPFHRRIHDFSLMDFYSAGAVFRPEFLAGPVVDPAGISKGYLDQAETPDLVDRYMFHDIKLTLMDNDLRKVTRMAEIAGVKVRFPYLDKALMEYTGTIPAGWKVNQGRLRHIFKESFKGLLPREIIEKKKHGFGLPVVRWILRPGKLNDLYREALFGGRLQARGIFQPGFLESLERLSRQPGTGYLGKYLYYIFFLELWLRAHVDGSGSR